MSVRRFLVCFLFSLAAGSQAFAEQPGYLAQAGLPLTSASRLADEPLTAALEEIESRTSLRTRSNSVDLTPEVAEAGNVVVVELNDLVQPWDTTFLFYRRDNRQALFMRVRPEPSGAPEVRLWSQGPSEIVYRNGLITRKPTPSSDTFRFRQAARELSVNDAIACLSSILGLDSTNWSSVVSVFTNLSCSQTQSVIFDTYQVFLHCGSIFSVGTALVTSTAGCVIGLTQLIGCGILSCSPPSVPSGLTASDGAYSDRVRVSWNQTQGASTYTLYRSQSSGSNGSAIMSNSSATSFEDTSAVAGYKYYYYRVRACSKLGCSDYSGYDSGWRSGGSGSGCSGTTYSGSLSAGGSAQQPNGSYYQSTASGTHTGNLVGPSGADFDLYLYKWNGTSWIKVASKATSSNVENLSYSGTAGYYAYLVKAYRGSGSYTLCIKHP